MKKYFKIGIVLGILLVIIIAIPFIPVTKMVDTELGNPASQYCLEHGGLSLVKTLIMNGSESQEGICEFSNSSQCEEWQYFRGECKPSS